jgi:hypothetical protein
MIGPELLIAVFWEKTLFENKRGVGRAVGFGQVQPSTITVVNRFWEKQDGKLMLRSQRTPHRRHPIYATGGVNDGDGVREAH